MINFLIADLKLFCTEKGILLKVFPEKPLDRPGRIYVKGQSEKQGCGTQMSTGLSEYEFNVPIGNCNMDKSATDKVNPIQLCFTVYSLIYYLLRLLAYRTT